MNRTERAFIKEGTAHPEVTGSLVSLKVCWEKSAENLGQILKSLRCQAK